MRFFVVAAMAFALLAGSAGAQPPVLGFTVSSGPSAAWTTMGSQDECTR